jgi:hypothetical protein
LLYRADPDEHARIFGAPDREDRPGAYRKCRTCGGWHPRGRVPHNCRPPAPPRNPDLTTPQLAPTFTPFRTGLTDNAEVIGDRRAKRNYMEKHDLAEYDEGVTKPDEHWTAQKEEEREIAELISTISWIMTLQPGEIIAVGFAGDRVPVTRGDRVEATIEGVGTLSNTLGGA